MWPFQLNSKKAVVQFGLADFYAACQRKAALKMSRCYAVVKIVLRTFIMLCPTYQKLAVFQSDIELIVSESCDGERDSQRLGPTLILRQQLNIVRRITAGARLCRFPRMAASHAQPETAIEKCHAMSNPPRSRRQAKPANRLAYGEWGDQFKRDNSTVQAHHANVVCSKLGSSLVVVAAGCGGVQSASHPIEPRIRGAAGHARGWGFTATLDVSKRRPCTSV